MSDIIWAALVLPGLVASLAFCVLYATTPGWYRTAIGRNLMAGAASLFGLFMLSITAPLAPVPGWAWYGGIATLDAVMWVWVYLLWRARREATQ